MSPRNPLGMDDQDVAAVLAHLDAPRPSNEPPASTEANETPSPRVSTPEPQAVLDLSRATPEQINAALRHYRGWRLAFDLPLEYVTP